MRQRPSSEGSPASITEENVSPLAYWVNAERGDSTYLNLGDKQLNLGDAAQAAIELAPVIERVRAKFWRESSRSRTTRCVNGLRHTGREWATS